MKRTLGEKIFDHANNIFMIVLIIVTIYPLLYVLFASISDPKELLRHRGLILIPLGIPTLEGYKMVLKNPNILSGYMNTILYVVIGTSINLVLTSITAFLLSRKDFYIKKIMMILIVITMFFQGGLIPLFFIVKSLKIYNTIWAVLLPVAINTYNMIIMRTFFQGIPLSLEEAAIVEGANELQVLTRIILPLSKPVIAVMILYYGVYHWNSWFTAMIFLRDRIRYPLQLFLREILIQNNSNNMVTDAMAVKDEGFYKELVKYCTIIIATVPILTVYPFLQKYFAKGVMIGALKG